MDTHRPKPKKTPSLQKKKSDLKSKTAGASGEICDTIGSPILPISPQLWPNNNAASSGHKRSPSQLQQEITKLDLGDPIIAAEAK